MVLWIILTEDEYAQLQRDGVYRITEADEDMRDSPQAFEWLHRELIKRVGPAPEGAVTPLRGWLRWEPGRPRPDLRWMRWNWHPVGKHALLQVDVPEKKVLLMDAHCWTYILNGWLVTDSEEEWSQLNQVYENLPAAEQKKMLHDNWRRAFDIEYAGEDDWRDKGNEVEAVFWELRKEQVRSVKKFTSVQAKGVN